MAKLTPMMEQYMNIKKEHKDMLVFYRLGDFYEMFFDDAKVASKELDLVLTGRDCGQEEKAPMCGVPYHSAEAYITKLVEKGYKVAICEQVEDAKVAKGIVKRDVVRIVTPGTIMDNSAIAENKNNYVTAIFKNKIGYGISSCDVTTGDFYTTSIVGTEIKDLFNEIGKFNPKEIIVNEEFEQKDDIKRIFAVKPFTYAPWAFNIKTCEKVIINHFNIFNLRTFDMDGNPLEICSSGALLNYLMETQKNSLVHISKIKHSNDDNHMILDLSSRRNLELTENIRDKKSNTLYSVLNKTCTPAGSRLLRNFIEQPLITKHKIEERLESVTEIKENFVLKDDLIELLSNIKDVERIISKIVYGTMNGRDLYALSESIKVFPLIKEKLATTNSKALSTIYNKLDTLDDIYNLIYSSIKEDPPFSIREGNIIQDGYNSDLDELREIKREGTNWLLKIEESEKQRTGIKNLKIKYNKIFGYYLEVTKSYLNLVPEDYVRKQTLANCERYITSELKEVEDKILSADDKIVDLEYAIFMQITDSLTKEIPRIQQSVSYVSFIDVITSFARVAESNNYTKPSINIDGIIDINNGRHPVVERITDEFIANNTYISNDNRLSIITGPNMAGKSTYMRQVALISIMAQIGSYIPADYGNIGIVDRIFTRVGASDDLATGQSTFMVEMNEVANILLNATKDSLLILDEIGRGTSTFDGLSIAWAILEYIADNNKLGSKTLFATHYHELAELEGKIDGVKNYSITVDKKGDKIIFLRKIKEGSIDHSYGIHVAKLAGIPDELIKRADNILHILGSSNNKAELKIESPDVFYEQLPQEESEVEKALLEIDVNNLTPMDALNMIYELKTMVKG